jgi:hypothetical protein
MACVIDNAIMHEFNDNSKHYPNMMHNYSRSKAKRIVDVNNQKMPHHK